MLIKNKGYAAYLVAIRGFRYEQGPEGVEIPITLEEHDTLYRDYKQSLHRKVHKLYMKFFNFKTDSN